MIDPQPPPGLTLTLGPRANPPAEIPPPEPPNHPLPPQNSKADGLETPNTPSPTVASEKNQKQALVMSLDEAHAPFMYATEGSFNFRGTFTDVEDPKELFIKSAKLIITTLQGGRFAPAAPTPELLDAADWAELSCALIAAIGRGYSLMYDKERADAAHKKEWTEAPDPKPLSPRYPTLFHRLSATADALNDQIVVDGQDDECNIAGWILEAKAGILREETRKIKLQVEEDWRQWQTDQFNGKAAAQEKEITEAVCKRNTNYFLSAAAELGLSLRPTPPTLPLPSQTLQGPTGPPPRGRKRTISGSAPSTEPTTPRKQKANPPRTATRAPSPRTTPRGRPTNPPDPRAPARWADPSPTPQPKKGDPPGAHAVLNLSPKVTLNLGPKVTTPTVASTGQFDAATIAATIQAAVAPVLHLALVPLAARLSALERSSMPPPIARSGPHPNPGEHPDQHNNAPLPKNHPNLAAQAEGDFTLVTHNGKGRKSRGKTNATGAETEQPRQTPASYAGVATTASALPQPPPQKKGGNPSPAITEVTILRSGGLLDAQKETQIRNRAADAIVREVRLKMAKATANPIRLRAGRWSINPRSRGNFVFSFDGNVPFDTIKSYEHILLSPLGSVGELCPSMGWTRFLANGVPVWDEDDVPFSPNALLDEVRALPGLKKVFFAMQPRWLTHPEHINTTYSSVTFAISDPDGSISATLTTNRAALFGKEVTIRKWIDKPAFIQCSRCHALGHNKASRVCTLSKESVRCYKCGGAHTAEEHDKRCPKKHSVAGICDCKRICLNCHNPGHDCKDPRCPARDQYRPRTARKPSKGKAKLTTLDRGHTLYKWAEEWEAGRQDPDEEWDEEAPGHPFSNFSPPHATLTSQTHTPNGPPVIPSTSEPAPTRPTSPHIMNIDYDYVDPLTNRPDSYDDLPTGGDLEPLSLPAAYSPSRPQNGVNPLAHD